MQISVIHPLRQVCSCSRLLVILGLLLPSVALGADVRLAPGTWLKIKGSFSHDEFFLAEEIELLDDHSASIKGQVDRVLPASGEFWFGPLHLRIDESSLLRDSSGETIPVERFEPGQRIKVALRLRGGSPPQVKRVRLLEGNRSARLRLEGPVATVLSLKSNNTRFTLLGVEVRTDSNTAWTGVDHPVSEIDDEDIRPAQNVRLGKLGSLSGEVRIDFKGKSNFDLADQIDTDLNTGRLRTRLELIFPSSPKVSGMMQIKAESEREIDDKANTFEQIQDLTLGQTYVMFHGIMGRHGSLQVGRSRLDDRRDWLYNRDVDAVRLLFRFSRIHLEASISEELLDPDKHHQETLNSHLLVRVFPGKRHAVSAYVLDRNDRYHESDGELRDFSPRLFGVQAAGESGRMLSYWLEAALARGSIEGTKLSGTALDAGMSLVLPGAWEPSVTLGYAFGTGDEDPFDDVDHTFRQSGLQLNNGKWNGVTSFRYYGELMRPELANLHVETIGVGLRPRNRTSFDLIYHRYRLDTPASEMIDGSVDDRRLNLVDLELGTEWDLVVGFEELRHVEFELDLAYYDPGNAFLGPTDPAFMARLKAKYLF